MAYNPFDDVIENDPAYKMQIGGATQNTNFERAVYPTKRPDYSQETFKPITSAIAAGYKLLTPEQETLDQIEKDQQLRSLATQQAFQGTEFDKYAGDFDLPGSILQDPKALDLLNQAGFKRESFTEGLSRTGQFLYGNQRQAFDKLKSGEQLTSEDRLSIALAPLDSLDFLLPPVAIKKLAGIGLKNVNSILRSTSDLPEVQQVKQFFGGSPVPAIGGRAEGPPGMVTEPRVTLAKEDGTGAGGSKLLTGAPPKNRMSAEFRKWREATSKAVVEDTIAKTDPKFVQDGKISRSRAHGAIKDYIQTNFPDIPTNNPKYFENFLDKVKKTIDPYMIPQSPGSKTKEFFVTFNNSYKKINPDAKAQPQYNYLNFKAEEFYKKNGERPDLDTLSEYIRQTDPEAAENFTDLSARGLDRIIYNNGPGKANKLPPPTKIFYKRGKLFGIKELIEKLSTEGIPNSSKIDGKGFLPQEFKADYDIMLASLRASDSMLNTIKTNFDKHLAKYTNEFNEPMFNYDSFTQFLRDNQKELNIPPRLFSFDKVNYSVPITSSKAKREINEVDKFLGGEKVDYRRPKFEGVTLPTPMRNFLSHMYRGMLQNKKKLDKDGNVIINKQTGEPVMEQVLLNNVEFVENYVMPFVGESTEKTVANLAKEYPEYSQWLRLEKKVDRYQKVLSDFLQNLKASGKYTDREIDLINSSLAPQKAHIYPIMTNLRDERFVGMAQDADNILVQPAVYNRVYQVTFDNVFKKLLKQFEGKETLQKLQTQKPKSIAQFRNSFGFDVSLTKFLNETNIDNPRQIDYLNFIYQTLNEELQKRGMVSVQSFNPKQKEIFQGLRFLDPNFVGPPGGLDFKEAGEVLIVGDPNVFTKKGKTKDYKPQFYMTVADEILRRNPDKLPLTTPIPKKGAKKTQENFVLFNKGGVSMVKGGMAIGGQNFTENMNKQDFTPDPAIDGDSAFQQAVRSGNLQALNLPKIFKGLGEAFGVFTPKKVGKPLTGEMSAVSPVAKSDFPLQSFTLEKLSNSKTNQARPQDWINELQGGTNKAPTSEIVDSGIFQYLKDYEKYFPNQKISKQKLLEVLEDNPISNLKIKIKGSETGDPAYDSYMGSPRHKNVGSARMDKAGEDYREVVIEAGTLPGQQTGDEFVNSSHFQEKNVLAFGRVGTYKNSAGDNVAVIQEMQTDYLTQVRKEQELLNAEIERLNIQKVKAEEKLQRAESAYDIQTANERLAEVNSKLPTLLKLQESKLIKPYPNDAGAELVPILNKQLEDLQSQIRDLAMQGARRENPEFLMMIRNLEEQQKQVLNQLLDLNRANEYELLAKGVKVPDVSDRAELERYISGDGYSSMKNVKTFPPTPLNNQADYVDAILKAVIKDAENRGINKIAIMPADVGANARWGKESEDAKKKFRNLYDKVGVQQLKNIAKKYGGTVQEEFVVDSTKGSLGLRFLNKGVDGEFQVLKETEIDPDMTIKRGDLGPSKPPEGFNASFLSEDILRVAKDYGPNEVVFRREIAPGQTMEYFVNVKQGDVIDQKFDLVPLGDADRAENATIIIEEFNPQRVKMNVLVLPESNKDKPMYLFKKKKGGIMPDDRLVSITDIYGDY